MQHQLCPKTEISTELDEQQPTTSEQGLACDDDDVDMKFFPEAVESFDSVVEIVEAAIDDDDDDIKCILFEDVDEVVVDPGEGIIDLTADAAVDADVGADGPVDAFVDIVPKRIGDLKSDGSFYTRDDF